MLREIWQLEITQWERHFEDTGISDSDHGDTITLHNAQAGTPLQICKSAADSTFLFKLETGELHRSRPRITGHLQHPEPGPIRPVRTLHPLQLHPMYDHDRGRSRTAIEQHMSGSM